MTEQEAIEIARRTAEEEGWIWVDRVDARFKKQLFGKGSGLWVVLSNPRMRGGPFVRVLIDDETGEVLDKSYSYGQR